MLFGIYGQYASTTLEYRPLTLKQNCNGMSTEKTSVLKINFNIQSNVKIGMGVWSTVMGTNKVPKVAAAT